MKGWISLHRQIMDHWLYKEKRVFSRYEAWLDIVMLASHEDATFVHGNEVVTVERGEFITSELKLMERWGWSKSKVRSFLDILQKDRMLDRKTDSKKTALKVHNYGVYQHFTDHEKTADDTTVDNTVDTQSINKQINKLTNKQKDKDQNIVDAKASTPRFVKPTIQQVFEYCQERKNNVDPNKWMDHYTSNGWKVGKNPMKDWKAAVRTWEKNSSTSLSNKPRNNSKSEKNKATLQMAMEDALDEQVRHVTVVSDYMRSLPEFRGD